MLEALSQATRATRNAVSSSGKNSAIDNGSGVGGGGSNGTISVSDGGDGGQGWLPQALYEPYLRHIITLISR